jgi:hypothetical protein
VANGIADIGYEPLQSILYFSNCTLCQKWNVDDSGLWLAAGRQMVADIE